MTNVSIRTLQGTAVLVLVMALAGPAWSASTVDNIAGQIQLYGAPSSLVPGADESDSAVTLFLENFDLTLSSNVTVNATSPGLYDSKSSLTPGVITAGTVVSDTYFHSDPVSGMGTRFTGSITFDTDILGVISRSQTLISTDSIFGLPAVTYAESDSARGFELSGTQDEFAISEDLRTLTFSVMTWQNVDDLRIITAGAGGGAVSADIESFVATPEPGTLTLLLLAFGALAWAQRLGFRQLRCLRNS